MLTGWTDFDKTFSSMDELRRRMERIWEGMDLELFRSMSMWPHANLTDAGESLVFQAELPGCGERDIEISLTQDGLTVSGERKAEAPAGYAVLRQERQGVSFSRSFELPCKIEPDKAEATVKDGVLTITLPKAAEAQPKRIEVKTH